MLPKFEYGHLYKFVVSLGLLLIAASIALPWLVLREAGPLMIAEDDLAGLTPVARHVIADKQQDYAWIVDNYGWLSGALAAVGIVTITYGLLRWKNRQDVADEYEEVQRDTVKAQLRDLSPVEVGAKLDREAEILTADAVIEPPTETPPPVVHPRPYSLSRDSLRTRIAEVESLLELALARAFADTHDVRANVRLQGAWGHPREIDALVESRSQDDTSYVIELKLIRNPDMLAMRTREAMLQTALATRAYEAIAPGPVAGVLLMVIDDDPEESAVDRARNVVRRLSMEILDAVTVHVVALVVTRYQLLTKGDELRHAIEAPDSDLDGLRA